jgi:C-terminal processing protease CtpA/Prc
VVDTDHRAIVTELCQPTTEAYVELLVGREFTTQVVAMSRAKKGTNWGLQLCAVMENDPTTVGRVIVVHKDGPADNAGLLPGDKLLAINDTHHDMDENNQGIEAALRASAKALNVLVLRAPNLSFSYKSVMVDREEGVALGFALSTLDSAEGAFVYNMVPTGPAYSSGLREKDWIYAINGETLGFRPHDDVLEMIKGAGESISFTIRPNNLDPRMTLSDVSPRLISIEITDRGLGMKIITPTDGVSYPRISSITPNGPLMELRQALLGDKIMRVNTVNMQGLSQQEAVATLGAQMKKKGRLELVLVKDTSPMPGLANIRRNKGTFDADDDTPTGSPKVVRKMMQTDIGRKVNVAGYGATGTIRFAGKHHESGKDRYGIEFDTTVGKNNGSVKGHQYFECPDLHGILVTPSKVTFVIAQSSPLRKGQGAEGDASGSSDGDGDASTRMNLEDAYQRILALAGDMNDMFESKKSPAAIASGGGGGGSDEPPSDAPPSYNQMNDDSDSDDDTLPTLATGGGGATDSTVADDDSSDDDALPELFGSAPPTDEESSDDEELPEMTGPIAGDDSDDDDEELPDLGAGADSDDDDDEALPDVGGGAGTADVDMDALMKMLNYDTSKDTEL